MSSPNRKKILVVDDEKELCGLLQDYLEEEGFEVRIAYNGEDGIEQARSLPPDLMLLDIRMPAMGGLEVLETLHGESPFPVVMMTAVGDLETARECLKMGAECYLTKPLDLAELGTCISEILYPQVA